MFSKRKNTRWLDTKGAMVCGLADSLIFFSLEILCGKETSDMTKEWQRTKREDAICLKILGMGRNNIRGLKREVIPMSFWTHYYMRWPPKWTKTSLVCL